MKRILALTIALFALPAAAAPPLLMIAIDGLRPQEWQRRDNGLDLPNLRGLAAGGTSAQSTKSAPPSKTAAHRARRSTNLRLRITVLTHRARRSRTSIE